MDFFQMLIVLAVAAAVLYAIQMIVVKAFIKEDAATIDDGRFNSRTSLNNTLNRKMAYYRLLNPAPMRWLVFCSNILLPAVAISCVWCMVSKFLQEGFLADAGFFLHLAFTVSTLIAAILIRGIDPPAFYASFLPGLSLLVNLIFPLSSFNWVTIAGIVVFVPLTAAHACYFIRRKDLFLQTLAQIKQKAAAVQHAA